MRLTNGDVRWLAENLREMHVPPDDWEPDGAHAGDTYYPDGPDAVMTSIGYVSLWADGSVNGTDVLDVDSVLSGHCPVCGALDTDDSTVDHSDCDDEDTVYLDTDGGPRTLTEARDMLIRYGGTTHVTIGRTQSDEYRVNFKDGSEATAYYTNDLADAYGTALEYSRDTP